MAIRHFRLRADVVMIMFALSAAGSNFSTVNSDRLEHFWHAVEGKNGPVTVVSFGDSMADSYRSPTYHLMNKIYDRLGSSGFSLNNYRNAALINLTNGAYLYNPPAELWYHFLLAVPPGAAVWWEREWMTGVYADQVGLFWISQPSGGTMRLLVSTNGGPWTTTYWLNGRSETPIGCYTNLHLPANYYRVRVESDTGTNYVLGHQALRTASPGLHAVFMDYFGISLESVTNVLPAVRNPIFAALRPDLLIWHMKEDGSLATSNRMEACESWWQNAAPGCDVLYVGTPWVALDTTTNYTMAQNTVVRNIALRHGRAYVDLMQPMVSYPWMVSNGYNIDGTHLSYAAGQICAGIMWNDLGLFGIGASKQLALSRIDQQLRLRYRTSSTATYQLQVSTNLQSWTSLQTNVVANAAYTTNFAPSGSVFFRLKLTPP
jgi:hypothetical protein